jgi:hypothetical protein
MKFIKGLVFSLISFLSLGFGNAFDPQVDIILNLIQSSFTMIQTTIDNPDNSFSIITDPTQRFEFISNILSSVDDISSSLADITPQILYPQELTIANTINDNVLNLIDNLTVRVSQYMLNENVTQFINDQNSRQIIVQRFNQTDLHIFENEIYNFLIQVPNITINLFNELADVSVVLSELNSYPKLNDDSIFSAEKILSFKVSDTFGDVLSSNVFSDDFEVVIPIDNKICPNCQTICTLWLDNWVQLTSFPIDIDKVRCIVPKENVKKLGSSNSEFTTLTAFSIPNNNETDNNNKLIYILPFVIGVPIIGLASYCIFKRKNKKNLSLLNQKNYQGLETRLI